MSTHAILAVQAMTEREYLPLIPPYELKQIRALLKSVAARRRLPAPAPAVDMDAAWARLLAAARSPVGGSWDDFFRLDDLEDSRLRKLAAVLDEQLLGGCLRLAAIQSGAPALSFVVQDSTDGKADWYGPSGGERDIWRGGCCGVAIGARLLATHTNLPSWNLRACVKRELIPVVKLAFVFRNRLYCISPSYPPPSCAAQRCGSRLAARQTIKSAALGAACTLRGCVRRRLRYLRAFVFF
eukprot:78823-Chlamydomonas_euryale.AAC.10